MTAEPATERAPGSDYDRIAAAIGFISERTTDQPSLDEIAEAVGLSSFHLQRLFTRFAGVSPKRFLQFLTVEHAKMLLDSSRSVLDASLDVGLSGPSRLHDHFIALEAVTPGEYKTGGEALEIRWGVHASPFGSVFIAITNRGICALSFITRDGVREAVDSLRKQWSEATLIQDDSATLDSAEKVFRMPEAGPSTIPLWVKGTNFQIQVWRALLSVPTGCVTTYGQVAQSIGRPAASRAVGQAVGLNPIAFLIPCHRVIRSAGLPGGYRWETTRKRAILAWESAARYGEDLSQLGLA